MSAENREGLIKQLRTVESGADFLDHVYHSAIKASGGFSSLLPGTLAWAFTEDEEAAKLFDSTGIQDSILVSNVSKARKLASLLIDEKGELNARMVIEGIAFLRKNYCSLGLNHHDETSRNRHFLKVLSILQEDPEVVRILKGISKPAANAHAEDLIRQTLQLPANESLTDMHARRAVMAAWLTYLRQNVGSCFATAPAIIIHDEQPVRFLTDLRDLLNTGRLKRTFGGVEYSFPMSPSWGIGELRRQIVIDRYATRLADAPGFITALSAAKMIDPSMPLDKKRAMARYGLREVISAMRPDFPGGITTCEAMLKMAILFTLGIKEEDLQTFSERPRDLVQQRLLNQVSKSAAKPNTKGEKIAYFQELFKAAAIAFKSVADNALLKTWEFTIASFAESKSDFTRWNLYQSLGLQSNEPGGIGECMHRFLNEKLKEYQKNIQDLQSHYELLFLQLKALEGRMKNASSESQLAWMKADYDSRYNEFLFTEEKRNAAHEKAKRFSGLPPFLSKFYIEKLPEYFQEIYDADMQEVAREFYDDSPAGFRLLCKHGRSNPSLWTMIYTAEQYVDSLAEFFTVMENEISVASEAEGLRDEISQLVTEMIRHLRTREFIESSFARIAAAHEVSLVAKPLDNLEKISKKPWAYTSGGTMGTLVSCVYSREQPPTEVSKWVENETELLAFYLDTLKTLPYNLAKPYYTDPEKSMLAYSPTHAFVVKPGMSPFLHGWQEDSYTFSWIRDRLNIPWKQFFSKLRLNQQMVYRLVDELASTTQGEFPHLIKNTLGKLPQGLTPKEFRDQAIDLLKNEGWMNRLDKRSFNPFEIDSILYNLLPLFPPSELKQKIWSIVDRIPGLTIPRNALDALLDQLSNTELSRSSLLGARDLREIAKALIILATGSVTSPKDLHAEISLAMQKLGFSMPVPFIFADTNWSREYLGFIVNPGTEEIELWRLDYAGTAGTPISEWKKWLNGSQKKPWGIYTKPFEYGQ